MGAMPEELVDAPAAGEITVVDLLAHGGELVKEGG